MKHLITAVIMLIAGNASATVFSGQKIAKDVQTVAQVGNLVNEPGLTYNSTFTLDTAPYAKITAMVNYGSATFTSKTFNDGSQSTGSITVASTVSLSGVTLTINRITITAGVDFAVGATPAITATNIASIINSSTACQLHEIITAQAIGAVVTTTSTLVGGNFNMAVSNAAKLVLSGAAMTGGTVATYSAALDTLTLASHGYTVGLPVLYTQGAVIGGLVTGTTYYIIPVDANTVKLSSTNAKAIIGSYIDITTQRAQITKNTYTIAPLAITGTPSYKWQMSNDDINYVDVAIASVTVSAYTYPYAVTAFEFNGFDGYNYRYLRLNVVAPTAGGLYLNCVIAAKQ